jgi:hypothetical protein
MQPAVAAGMEWSPLSAASCERCWLLLMLDVACLLACFGCNSVSLADLLLILLQFIVMVNRIFTEHCSIFYCYYDNCCFSWLFYHHHCHRIVSPSIDPPSLIDRRLLGLFAFEISISGLMVLFSKPLRMGSRSTDPHIYLPLIKFEVIQHTIFELIMTQRLLPSWLRLAVKDPINFKIVPENNNRFVQGRECGLCCNVLDFSVVWTDHAHSFLAPFSPSTLRAAAITTSTNDTS